MAVQDLATGRWPPRAVPPAASEGASPEEGAAAVGRSGPWVRPPRAAPGPSHHAAPRRPRRGTGGGPASPAPPVAWREKGK